MKEHLRRLRTPGPWLFKHAWVEHAQDVRLHSSAEAWHRNGEKLRQSWEVFMQSILCPSLNVASPAWTALQLLLERQHDLRWLWVKPGGYFFTKAGNRRKIIRTKLIPRIITVTLRDRLANAERIYYEALKSEIFNYDAIEVATLALAGCIIGTLPAKRRSLREQYKQHKRRFRLWPPTRTNSLRYLCRIGFLQQPRDNDPRI